MENGRKFNQLGEVEWSQDKKQVRILLKDEILQSAGKFLF
jgi:hypothetical protein